MRFIISLMFLSLPVLAAAGTKDDKPLPVVPPIDLNRYAGKWYEIARFPNRFQKSCTGEVTAAYSLIDQTHIQVVNECRKKNGNLESAQGKARLADKDGTTSKLKVRFAPSWLSWLPAVWGDYWVIDLASDYSYSMVGTPDRKYLWILSRSSTMDNETYTVLSEKAASLGFNASNLVRTRQSP